MQKVQSIQKVSRYRSQNSIGRLCISSAVLCLGFQSIYNESDRTLKGLRKRVTDCLPTCFPQQTHENCAVFRLPSNPRTMTQQVIPTSDIFHQLDQYPWESDQEFQTGLHAILGSSASQEQAEYLTLRAKCFYYSRYIASDDRAFSKSDLGVPALQQEQRDARFRCL